MEVIGYKDYQMRYQEKNPGIKNKRMCECFEPIIAVFKMNITIQALN